LTVMVTAGAGSWRCRGAVFIVYRACPLALSSRLRVAAGMDWRLVRVRSIIDDFERLHEARDSVRHINRRALGPTLTSTSAGGLSRRRFKTSQTQHNPGHRKRAVCMTWRAEAHQLRPRLTCRNRLTPAGCHFDLVLSSSRVFRGHQHLQFRVECRLPSKDKQSWVFPPRPFAEGVYAGLPRTWLDVASVSQARPSAQLSNVYPKKLNTIITQWAGGSQYHHMTTVYACN